VNTATHEPEVLDEREVAPALPEKAGVAVDVQIATARKFPRSVTTFTRRAIQLATLNDDIATACVYAMPRGGRTIEGPSARFAEIMAHAWGNLRIQAGTVGNDDKHVTSRGEAWDLEVNTAIAFEVKRRITNRKGDTYDDDMITVTGNAGASIALRNAVLKVVPAAFWKPVYAKCREVIAGNAETFASRRDAMLKAFMVVGVTVERVVASIGLRGVGDITLDHMATLAGILNAIKEGETSIEDAFPEGGGLSHMPQPAPRKSQQQNGTSQPPAGQTAAPSPQTPASSTDATPPPESAQASELPDPRIGTITDVTEVQPGIWRIALSTGFKCGTRDAGMVTGAKQLAKDGTRVELATKAPQNPAYAPTLIEITPLTGAGV
jgi:hypothetical protein